MDANPYRTTDTTGPKEPAPSAEADVSDEVVHELRSTRPFLIGFAALGFIGCALMLLGGVGVLISTMISPIDMPTYVPMMVGSYVILGLVFLAPTVNLLRYSMAVSHVVPSGGMAALAVAMKRQRAYWLSLAFCFGLMILVYFALMAVIFATTLSQASASG